MLKLESSKRLKKAQEKFTIWYFPQIKLLVNTTGSLNDQVMYYVT